MNNGILSSHFIYLLFLFFYSISGDMSDFYIIAYKINLNPEFEQNSEPVLDVMMFEVPPALQSWPHLNIALIKPGMYSHPPSLPSKID
jgi:hypothetical protein